MGFAATRCHARALESQTSIAYQRAAPLHWVKCLFVFFLFIYIQTFI